MSDNPFRHMGQWYWKDAHELIHGPYNKYQSAMFDLLDYCYPPTGIVQRCWRKWVRFKYRLTMQEP